MIGWKILRITIQQDYPKRKLKRKLVNQLREEFNDTDEELDSNLQEIYASIKRKEEQEEPSLLTIPRFYLKVSKSHLIYF